MTVAEFFAAFDAGQRHFTSLDFEYEDGFSGKGFFRCDFRKLFFIPGLQKQQFTRRPVYQLQHQGN